MGMMGEEGERKDERGGAPFTYSDKTTRHPRYLK